MSLKKYAFIKDSGGTLPADKIIAEIGDQAVPILWCAGEGQFCLVPQAVVQNLLELYTEFQRAQGGFDYRPTLQIMWSQGIEMDNQIGRILAGE